jgi:hypothetical protein
MVAVAEATSGTVGNRIACQFPRDQPAVESGGRCDAAAPASFLMTNLP